MPATSARQASNNIAAALAAGKAGAVRALYGVGAEIERDVQVSLASPMFPSRPGTPPALRTGGLQASYRWVPGRTARGRDFVAIQSDHRAAAILEFGDSRQAPRPALRPAINRHLPRITPEIARGWNAAQRTVRGR